MPSKFRKTSIPSRGPMLITLAVDTNPYCFITQLISSISLNQKFTNYWTSNSPGSFILNFLLKSQLLGPQTELWAAVFWITIVLIYSGGPFKEKWSLESSVNQCQENFLSLVLNTFQNNSNGNNNRNT